MTGRALGSTSSGRMPRSRFRLSKAGKRAYAIGSAWRWCFVEFEAAEQSFVVRILLSQEKMRAYAQLAIRHPETLDCAVICSLEYHPDHHTGWHIHSPCGAIEDAPVGTLVHGPWVKRIPHVRAYHRQTMFYAGESGGAEAWLLRKTLRFFRIDEEGSLL